MSLNPTPTQSAARAPRAVVRINGVAVPGWITWTVTNNSYFEADTFRVNFALSQLPPAYDGAWFTRQTEVFVEVFAGFPSDPNAPSLQELQGLIYGRVDEMTIDPVQGVLELAGRDLTAAFIDTKISKDWTNQTASAIATQMAQGHGLSAAYVTNTTAKVGTYYKADQMRLRADQSEWDVLAYLAREEGMVLYVTGNELHFEPDTRSESVPYLIQRNAAGLNAIGLKLSRSMTVAKGITVTVRSPSRTSKTPVVQSYPSQPKAIQAGKASPFGNSQAYYFTMTADKKPMEVQAFAETMYRAIVDHAVKAEIQLPADDLMDIGTPVRIDGTGTDFDQLYYPHEIVREMSCDGGYTMSVHAQNYSPDLAPV